MQSATFPHGSRSLLAQYGRNLGGKRLLLAVGISLLLSTQLLFQDSLFENFFLSEIMESVLLYFLDVLIIAVLLVGAVSLIDARWPQPSVARHMALPIAVVGSVLVGMAIQMGMHYGAGPYPSQTYLLGEAARSALIAGSIILIFEHIRRHQNHSQRLHVVELRHKILENQMIESRIKMMEAQIEPHFLFNTLATVRRLYRTEPVSGARMVDRLKEYLQAALPQIRHGMPTLATELELVRAYLEILQIRMGSRLEFRIDGPVSTMPIPFPAMVLITLVENSIKHGLNPMPNGGRIEIHVFDAIDTVAIEVRDNGVGFQVGAGTSGSGMGLANIRSRLAQIYGAAAALSLVQGQPAGVVARVAIAKKAAMVIASELTSRTAPDAASGFAVAA